jgi:hypothetical protein
VAHPYDEIALLVVGSYRPRFFLRKAPGDNPEGNAPRRQNDNDNKSYQRNIHSIAPFDSIIAQHGGKSK